MEVVLEVPLFLYGLDSKTHHDIVEIIPWQPITLRNHGRCNQWRQYGSQTIKCVQKPQHLVRIRHIAYPRIPGRISQAIPESSQHEDED